MATKQKVLFKFGTAAQYAALSTKLDNALYFLTDTNELYRGSVPFGKPHVYTGNRAVNATDAETITALIGENTPVQGDLIVVHNTDGSSDAFAYSANGAEWLHIGNTVTDSLVTRVSTLETKVADLETLLEGTEQQDGLIDRVSDLETALTNAAGAFHFKGVTEDLNSIQNQQQGDVYQVGTSEYAWNGNAWVELGTPYDLSNYVTQTELQNTVSDLEALIGQPASTVIDPITSEETTTPASGIYADLAERANEIIPLFNGVIAGLVPVDNAALSNAEKAKRFLNALGNWVEVSTTGGQTTYTDPDGNVYNNVEDYVTYMINNYAEQVWESMDE